MAEDPPAAMDDPQEEIAALVRTLHETQQRLQELAGGEVDAVLHPAGQSYLLHEAQERLRGSEAVQRTFAATQSSILNALPAHVALLDHAGLILSVNDGWRHFGESNGLQSATSTVGQNYLEICDRSRGDCGDEAHRAAAGIRAVLAGTTDVFSLEYPCHAPTKRRWFLLRANRLEQGNRNGAVVMHIDITERKQLEQQFLRAQRMESIGTLAGGIAHDLNNVLGPIMMSLEMLKMRFPDPASQELLAIIGSSARHGADMVSQVLSFARGVEGRRMEVQVRHLIEDIEKIANDTFLKHIQVRTIFPNDLWTVLGDPTQLHQVLLNLCVNARDAMPDGGTLTLSAENLYLDAHDAGLQLEAKAGCYVYLRVKDTGTGMAPEVIEKIFDPFFTTKEVGKGTGLGLSTTLAIVKSHGGYLRVYSEPGRGTEFKVYLPAQTETAADPVARRAAEIPRGHGELILVVDDETAVRKITQQTLELFGYRVIGASSGAEAVDIFRRQSAEIAVVLTDMTMPGMDGPATIQALREIDPAVRIIATSGLSAKGYGARATGLGVNQFLSKPSTAETLLRALQQVISAGA